MHKISHNRTAVYITYRFQESNVTPNLLATSKGANTVNARRICVYVSVTHVSLNIVKCNLKAREGVNNFTKILKVLPLKKKALLENIVYTNLTDGHK